MVANHAQVPTIVKRLLLGKTAIRCAERDRWNGETSMTTARHARCGRRRSV